MIAARGRARVSDRFTHKPARLKKAIPAALAFLAKVFHVRLSAGVVVSFRLIQVYHICTICQGISFDICIRSVVVIFSDGSGRTLVCVVSDMFYFFMYICILTPCDTFVIL
jgi:hypothetical protein